MLYLFHRARSLSCYLSLPCFHSLSCYLSLSCLPCHHAYVYFRFIHVMMLYLVCMLKDHWTYQTYVWPSLFRLFSSVSPQVTGRKYCCLVRTSSAWRSSWMAWTFFGYGYFTWGIIYEKVFMLLYYCKTGFDVFWCKRL